MLDNQYEMICGNKLSLGTKKTNRPLQATEGDESCVGITGGYPINLSLLFFKYYRLPQKESSRLYPSFQCKKRDRNYCSIHPVCVIRVVGR